MSDLSAAAAALGLPETLVQRSAEARAAETGASVDDILAGWAGGKAAPAAPAEPATPEAEQPADEPEAGTEAEPAEEPSEATPEVVVEVPAAQVAADRPSGAPAVIPVLVGARDNPMAVLAGAVGLFLIVVLVGLVGPSLPIDEPGARTSHIDFSDSAMEGREVYLSAGCASCHTQMVRPVVADVGLGAVTLSDSNQVVGTRRFGPDLSDVGSRLTGDQLGAIVAGLGTHPPHDLGAGELADLVAYLEESVTGGGSGEGES